MKPSANSPQPPASNWFRRYFLGALFSVVAVTTASAAGLALPALSSPPSQEHHPGKVIWFDLTTPDLAAAERFYSGLFGWTFLEIHSAKTDYAVASSHDRLVGGLAQAHVPSGQSRQPAWLGFIAVGDVDLAKKSALAHGGKLLAEPRTFPGRGRQAVLADPDGAVFGVLASASGDPADDLAEPGEWIWTAVLAKDANNDAAFYQSVFGYDVFDLPSDDASTHVILSSDDYARASVNNLPSDTARRHPHWLNFVRVDDTSAAAAKAVQLGGRILVAPHLDRHGGQIAVIADPAGAPLGLMEWTDTDSKLEPK